MLKAIACSGAAPVDGRSRAKDIGPSCLPHFSMAWRIVRGLSCGALPGNGRAGLASRRSRARRVAAVFMKLPRWAGDEVSIACYLMQVLNVYDTLQCFHDAN
jgi:hypothetical protein